MVSWASPGAQMVRNSPAMHETGFDPWVKKIHRRREWLHTPIFMSGETSGWKSLAGYSPWGCKQSDTTEQLSTYDSLENVFPLGFLMY